MKATVGVRLMLWCDFYMGEYRVFGSVFALRSAWGETSVLCCLLVFTRVLCGRGKESAILRKQRIACERRVTSWPDCRHSVCLRAASCSPGPGPAPLCRCVSANLGWCSSRKPGPARPAPRVSPGYCTERFHVEDPLCQAAEIYCWLRHVC